MHKNKILVIGQAPPYQKQDVPYSTTMLYDWLSELGISKEKAQELFEWEAVYDRFPGYNIGGVGPNRSHKVPSKEQMDDYWTRSLKVKCTKADKIWVLGRVAFDFLYSKLPLSRFICKPLILHTMHPSKRNLDAYQRTKADLLKDLRTFLNIEL